MARWPSPKKHPSKRKHGTALTFSEDELSALAQFVDVGQAVMQKHHPVAARIRGAMTRLGLTPPSAL